MYVVELESLSLRNAITESQIGLFTDALRTNRRIARAVPSADPDRSVFELRATVDATGPANALAVAEVAFEAALRKASLAVDIALANVWIDEPDKIGVGV